MKMSKMYVCCASFRAQKINFMRSRRNRISGPVQLVTKWVLSWNNGFGERWVQVACGREENKSALIAGVLVPWLEGEWISEVGRV